MYKVVNWCQQDGKKAYAVMDTSTGGIEFVSEGDLALLTFVGLEMQTLSGEPVTINGDNLVCNVEEYIPAPEGDSDGLEDDGVDFMDFEDEDETGDGGESDESDDYGLDSYEDGSEDEGEDDDIDPFFGFDIDDEDDMPEGNNVSKLYAMLTQDQITVLRRYYLWYSQRLFTDAQKDDTYGLKSKSAIIRKRQQLKNLRQGGDYRYAGFLDTGSRRLGYTCSLGHPLRYMHLAWDITVGDIETAFFGEDYNINYEAVIQSNNCIAFGIKCIGDFFEVDQECIRSLQRAQRDSLRDMDLLYNIYTTEDIQAVKDSFKLLDEVIKITGKYDLKRKMLGNVEPTIPFSVAAFYNQFRAADLIPPKSLIQEIRSCLVGWTDGKKYFSNKWSGFLRYPEKSFFERLNVIAQSKKYEAVSTRMWINVGSLRTMHNLTGFGALMAYIYLLFTYEICGYYKYTATKDGFSDEGGYDKSKVGYPMRTLYARSIHNQVVGGGFDLATFMVVMDLARVCTDAKKKYTNTESQEYKLPYYSEMSEEVYHETLKMDYYSQPSNRLRRMLRDAIPDEAKRNRAYQVLKVMSNVTFQTRDMMVHLLSTNIGSTCPDFKPCVQNKQFDVKLMTATFEGILSEFDTLYEELLNFTTKQCEEDKAAHEKKKADEAAQRIREEREAREAREAAKKEEAKKLPQSGETSMVGVVNYLLNADLSGVTDPKFDFAINKILNTLRKSGKEPSQRQFYYLIPLYEEVSGVVYSGEGKPAEKVDLESRQDIKAAIDWIEYYPVRAKAIAKEQDVADFDKLVSILGSIKRYGKISERQMPYAETALAIVAAGTE